MVPKTYKGKVNLQIIRAALLYCQEHQIDLALERPQDIAANNVTSGFVPAFSGDAAYVTTTERYDKALEVVDYLAKQGIN